VNRRGTQFGFGPPQTPQVIKNLVIANGLVFIAQVVTGGNFGFVSRLGSVSPADVWLGLELWRPLTYMWLHSPSSPFHIIFNMFALWMFGSNLALVWGDKRFLRYYLVCGIGAGVLIATVPWLPVLVGLVDPSYVLGIPTLGASGAVMGVVLAYSFTWPDRTIMLMIPPMPIKAIWIIPVILVLEFMTGPSNVSHLGHLGGVAVGWLYLLREGRTPGAPTLQNLKYRWHRYRMRQKIRAVHEEERRERQRSDRDDRDGPRRYH
jgi:membrane associated rhomboid family serine protease